MHLKKKVLLILTGIVTLTNLSGCIVAERDRGPYRYEHGDRIDHYGHRESGWCGGHHDDEHCR